MKAVGASWMMMKTTKTAGDNIYSCDPAEIPAWAEEKKQEFQRVIAEMFNWGSPKTTQDTDQLKPK